MATVRDSDSGLLSPARSEVSTTYIPNDVLPTPRSHPLPPNSAKKAALINYLDDRILNLTRRYAKSFAADRFDRGDQSGYLSFSQIIADIDGLLDVVWISATPTIQIPYLLALAGHFRGCMHSFAFDTRSFSLAEKLDHAFSRLLTAAAENPSAHDIDMTDKVRIRSLAQETRFVMVQVASKSGFDVSRDRLDIDDDGETETDATETEGDANDQSIALSLGKVYENTLEILGGDLSSLPPPNNRLNTTPPRIVDDVEVIDL